MQNIIIIKRVPRDGSSVYLFVFEISFLFLILNISNISSTYFSSDFVYSLEKEYHQKSTIMGCYLFGAI